MLFKIFEKPLKELDFDFAQFETGIHSFSKLSAARREDYMKMEEVTNITEQYVEDIQKLDGYLLNL